MLVFETGTGLIQVVEMPGAIHRYMDGRKIGGFPTDAATMAQAAMSKRALAWIVVALAGLLSTAGLLFFMFGTSKLTFSEAEVQERLNNKLPRTVRDMTIERMVARLAENRMALRVEVKGTVLRQPIAAVVTARGVPRYEAQKGEMFFDADDVKLGQLTVAGRSVAGEEDAATRKRMAEAASKAVQGLAQAAIKAYLASRPVYRFKEDFKGVVLKAALVDVAIQENTLAVTFSLWRLSTMVAVFAFAHVCRAAGRAPARSPPAVGSRGNRTSRANPG